MQIFVKNIEGQTEVYEVCNEQIIGNLNEMICEREQIPIENQRLYYNGKQLDSVSSFMNLGIEQGSTINCVVPLVGGGQISNTNMEPAFIALCEKYVYNKKICRDCYATNPAKAKTCRKRKCGRSGQLRMKKVAKK